MNRVLVIALVIGTLGWVTALGAIYYGTKGTNKAVEANCQVVGVLLQNRADRDKTVKLFDSIRRQNPTLFDRLVKRAEAGDRRLEQVRGDLACKV